VHSARATARLHVLTARDPPPARSKRGMGAKVCCRRAADPASDSTSADPRQCGPSRGQRVGSLPVGFTRPASTGSTAIASRASRFPLPRACGANGTARALAARLPQAECPLGTRSSAATNARCTTPPRLHAPNTAPIASKKPTEVIRRVCF
jgi:hypothetical protein